MAAGRHGCSALLLGACLFALTCEHGAEGQWPICYDYKVADKTQCPMRDEVGQLTGGTDTQPVCYQTNLWKETSPPPNCRNTGCREDATSACCCGADQDVPNARDPNLDTDKPDCAAQGTCTKCGGTQWGSYIETGGAAGQCEACKTGLGGGDGVGGQVVETYGDPTVRGTPLDFQTYGHVYELDYKLPTCSSEVKTKFQKLENLINSECDAKTYLAMRKCGNCWRAICEFHNMLHWTNGPAYLCCQDLFVRRMDCYRTWYQKYCDCKVTFPSNDIAGDRVWLDACQRVAQPSFELNVLTGIYPLCSHAPRGVPDWGLLAVLALAWPLVRRR